MTDVFEKARQSTSLPDLAASYGLKLKKSGAEFQALCPFHSEDTPSFSIFIGKDRVQRYKCFGCGAHGDVIDFVQGMKNCTRKQALEIIGLGEFTISTPEQREARGKVDHYKGIEPVSFDTHPFVAGALAAARLYNPKKERSWPITPSLVHEYRRASGELFGLVIRRDYTDPDTGKRMKETPTVRRVRLPSGDVVWSRFPFGMNRPLYGIETVGDAKSVILVEGEKAADALRKAADAPVLTWAGGVKAIHYSDWKPLRDRELIVWPDADDEGESAVRWLRSNFNSTRIKVVG